MLHIAISNTFFMVAVNVCGSAVWKLLQIFLLAPRVECCVLGKFVKLCCG
jgi:hypothetical protein